VFYNKENYIVIWVRMHARFPISKPNLLLPVAISIKKKHNYYESQQSKSKFLQLQYLPWADVWKWQINSCQYLAFPCTFLRLLVSWVIIILVLFIMLWLRWKQQSYCISSGIGS